MDRKDGFVSMTIDNVRRIDRAPIAKKHEGSYYGYALKRVLNAVPPDSLAERNRQMTWLVVCLVVPVAVLLAALIVTGIAGDLIQWMVS